MLQAMPGGRIAGLRAGPARDGVVSPRSMGRGAPIRPAVCLIGVLVMVCGCASTATTDATFYRVTADETPGRETVQLTRSCQVGDCRVQAVTMSMPDGRVLEGTLTIVPAGSTGGAVGITNLQGASAAAAPARPPNARMARMSLSGDGGERLQCQLLLRVGGRHATGSCRSADGLDYRIEY